MVQILLKLTFCWCLECSISFEHCSRQMQYTKLQQNVIFNSIYILLIFGIPNSFWTQFSKEIEYAKLQQNVNLNSIWTPGNVSYPIFLTLFKRNGVWHIPSTFQTMSIASAPDYICIVLALQNTHRKVRCTWKPYSERFLHIGDKLLGVQININTRKFRKYKIVQLKRE